jgi:general secretion pathway protein G
LSYSTLFFWGGHRRTLSATAFYEIALLADSRRAAVYFVVLLPIKINPGRVVVAITGLVALCFAGIAVVDLWPKGDGGSKYQRVRGDFSGITSSLKMYQIQNGSLPSSFDGLEALVNKPARFPAGVQWSRLMDAVPLDPWGNAYMYVREDSLKDGFGLYSLGQDGRSLSHGNDADDIVSWEPAKVLPPLKALYGGAMLALTGAATFMFGGLAGIYLSSRPERLFVFSNGLP